MGKRHQLRLLCIALGFALWWLACHPAFADSEPKPSDTEAALGASIAAAPVPAEAAAAKTDQWSPGLVSALISEGVAREDTDIAAAEALYRLSAGISSKIGDSTTNGIALSDLGSMLVRRLAFGEAIADLRKALALQTADGQSAFAQLADASITATRLGIALNNSGQSDEAVRMAARAVELAKASGNELALGRAYSISGSAATLTGNHRSAIFFLEKALTIAEAQKSLAGQATVLNNLGIASRKVFDFDASADYFRRSLVVKSRQGPNARIASSLLNLGELALVQNHLDEAEVYFRQTIDSLRGPQEDDLRAGALINLGLVAQGRHQFRLSLDSLNQGIGIATRIHDLEAFGLAHLSAAAAHMELNQLGEAQADIEAMRELTRDSGNRRISMRLAMAQGDIYRRQGRIADARAEYLKAIAVFESLRLDVAADESVQSGFDDKTRYVYQNLISLDAKSGQTASAFRYSELSKSRVLLDDLLSGRGEMKRLLTAHEAKRNTELLSRLADLNLRLRSGRGPDRGTLSAQIDQLRIEYSNFRTGVYAAHPELALRRADPTPISVSRAAAILPDDQTALLSYSVGENSAYVFTITRQSGKPVLRVHDLQTNARKLGLIATAWRTQIAGRELSFTRLAQELYAALVQPALKDLTGVDRLIVLPDGPLWQIPFEALQTNGSKYLIEQYEIFYAPSATVLDKMRSVSARRSGTPSLLALGDPAGDLPEAASEVAAIGKLYGAGHTRVLTGTMATEAALATDAGRYSVIHIAAHGKYDDAKPVYSYLALAPSSGDDGNLEAGEIMDLHLLARLVVLSGCETARGGGSGEGVAGMAWSMFIAGAPTTVASLWKVDSRSTSELMSQLHKGLTQGETTARSLREAKLALLRNPAYLHPFYWAGFIGIGAGT